MNKLDGVITGSKIQMPRGNEATQLLDGVNMTGSRTKIKSLTWGNEATQLSAATHVHLRVETDRTSDTRARQKARLHWHSPPPLCAARLAPRSPHPPKTLKQYSKPIVSGSLQILHTPFGVDITQRWAFLNCSLPWVGPSNQTLRIQKMV